jgi:hypothetical protein
MDLNYIPGDKIDRKKWDRCIDKAVNGNICAYSWFLDIMCSGWGGLVADNYAYIMPLPVASRYGVSYILQPGFIQQLGVFGIRLPDSEIISRFLTAIPNEIKVVDYHFNDQNNMPSGWNVEMRNNFLLKLDKPYEVIKTGYTHNLVRNLKKSDHAGFHIIINNDPLPLIKMFREQNRQNFLFLKVENWQRLSSVIHACLSRNKAKVWSVYNQGNVFCGGIVWLFSQEKAVFYFSAQSKVGRNEGAMAWLIDAFIRDNTSSDIVLDFEGSVMPGLARFYGSFGSVMQLYPRLTMNRLSPFLKMLYRGYRKLKKA